MGAHIPDYDYAFSVTDGSKCEPISQARGALDALAAFLPSTAERVKGADTEAVALSELRVGDIVLVRPGARVPADGLVVEGTADVDESSDLWRVQTCGAEREPAAKVIAGNSCQRWKSSRQGYRSRGPDRSFWNHDGSSRPPRLLALGRRLLADRAAAILFYMWRSRGWRDHFHLLVDLRRQRARLDSNVAQRSSSLLSAPLMP